MRVRVRMSARMRMRVSWVSGYKNQIIEEAGRNMEEYVCIYSLKVCCCVCDGVLSTALCDPTWSLNGGGTPSRKHGIGLTIA